MVRRLGLGEKGEVEDEGVPAKCRCLKFDADSVDCWDGMSEASIDCLETRVNCICHCNLGEKVLV
jgi:hypothetical protein